MTENIRGSIMSADGREVKFKEDTGKNCPTCNPHGMRKDATLFVRSIVDNTVEIECKNCGYAEFKPKGEVLGATDIHGRPTKPPSE